MMTPAVWSIVEQMARQFPLPQGDPGPAHEDACRMWTRRLAEQLRYSCGAEWGHKAQSPSHPPSKDAVAFWSTARFLGYDTMRGASTGHPVLATYPPLEHDLTGQMFIVVDGVNHLGLPPDPDGGGGDDDGEECECDLEADLAAIRQSLETLTQQQSIALELLSRLVTLTEAQPSEAALRTNPLPVKLKW